MKIKQILIFSLILLKFSFSAFPTTWNEPWHDEVVKNADSFVLARIESFDTSTGVSIEIIKTISGNEIIGKVQITGFYLLNLTSVSVGIDEGLFNFSGFNEVYFFIKQDVNGNYCIATPTTGFAKIENRYVYATYRHSYHQALVPVDIYETTMAAIFNNYHNQSYNILLINEYIKNAITQASINIDRITQDLFYSLHVALESIYHLRLSGYYAEILPFLSQELNFHIRVSAIRVLIAYNTEECKNELLKIISSESSDDFIKVIAIWTLSEFKPNELKTRLIELESVASNRANGFGGNLMDPRIGTYMPTVKTALRNLIDTLE